MAAFSTASRVLVVALVLATLAALVGCGGGKAAPGHEAAETRFFYDGAGRLAAVEQEDTTAVYRFDAAGNRVAVDRVRSRDFDPDDLRPRSQQPPKVSDVSPTLVAQGSTVVVTGHGFDTEPMGNVVAVGGALGRVLSASSRRLQVQLPPIAVPGPVTVSTAYGHDTSKGELVVAPAEVSPTDVDDVAATDIGKSTTLAAGATLLTFHGRAGDTVALRLGSKGSGDEGCGDEGCGDEGCDVAEVGLAGPTGTIVEADAGESSWCERPAKLPMTGTYTALVDIPAAGRASVVETDATEDNARLPGRPVAAAASQATDPPATDGPPAFPVDLASGLMDSGVTDLGLAGSGAVDLRRMFSVGDPDLPALAPEEPLARHWSLAGSIALEPSMSYSYLDLVMPDGRRLPFQRVTAGAPEPTGAVFEPSGGVGSGPFAGSRVAFTGSGWELRTRTGTVVGFGRTGSPLRLGWVRGPHGETARFIRGPDDTDGSPDGDLVGVISQSGQWARFDHDSEGRISAATDQVGDRVTYGYDRPDQVFADVLTRVTLERVGAPARVVGYRYQPLTGRLAAVTDGRRDRIRFEYDEAGRVVRQRVLRPAAPGATTGEWRYSYVVGQRRATIPGRSGSIRLPQVNRVVVDGPDGRRTVRFRDGRPASDTASETSAGSVVRAVRQPWTGAIPASGTSEVHGPGGVPAGDVSSGRAGVFVDARGRVAARRTADGAVTRIGYDAFDRPASITSPASTTSPASITNPAGTTQLSYTSGGDLASVTDAAGTTRHSWNRVGQQTGETDPLGGSQRWRYDASGQLVWSREARGVVSTFSYDDAGRVVVAAYGVRPGAPPESRVHYTYDRAGRLVRVDDSGAGSASLRYDADGNLVGTTTGTGSVTAAYDDHGNRTSVHLPGGVREGYDYDGSGRPVRLSLGEARVVAAYDSKGRLAGLDLPNGVRGSFDHGDADGAVLRYTRNGHDLVDQRAGHDAAGRVDRLAGDLGRPSLPATQAEGRFDAAHQLVSRGAGAFRHDRAGNLLQDAAHHYTWDARGRLVTVAGPEGRTTYGYDALGRRTSASTDGTTVRYVYDGDDVVQRIAADGTRTTYLRGPDGTPLVSSDRAGTVALLPDLFGNVGAAVDADGKLQRFSYDPFGVSGGGSTPDLPGFRGLLSDPTGQVSMGARSYDPSTGRFLSRDTWGIDGGDTDTYRYALGAPTVFTDPSGHAAECVGMALGWAMSVLGPNGGWDDYDALQDQVDSGQISEDEWAVKQDRLSHDLWAGFDLVANVCGTSAVGTSAAALPLLGAGKVTSPVLGSLADDAVAGAGATRVGSGFGVAPGVSERARASVARLLAGRGIGAAESSLDLGAARFAQRSFSESFGAKGAFAGRRIDDVAEDLRSGNLSAKDVPINVVVRDGTVLISNTRSAQALRRAGIPRNSWNVIDRTGDELFERLLSGQLRRNGLDSSGVDLP